MEKIPFEIQSNSPVQLSSPIVQSNCPVQLSSPTVQSNCPVQSSPVHVLYYALLGDDTFLQIAEFKWFAQFIVLYALGSI